MDGPHLGDKLTMKLIGNLKEQVGKANDKEEARGLIRKAGMLLTDDELNMVAGGQSEAIPDGERSVICYKCRECEAKASTQAEVMNHLFETGLSGMEAVYG